MPNPIQIIPNITVKTLQEVKEKINLIDKYFQVAHYDIADATFAGNDLYSDLSFVDQMQDNLQYDVHIMSGEPKKYILALLKIKKIRKIDFHFEINEDVDQLINLIRKNKKKVGIAILIDTSIEKIEKYLARLDCVLVMGGQIGKYGSKFQPEALKKIQALRQIAPKLDIAVDVGVKDYNINNIHDAGANIFYLGSYMYANDMGVQKQKLIKALNLK